MMVELPSTIRRVALEKLATLAAQAPEDQEIPVIDRITQPLKQNAHRLETPHGNRLPEQGRMRTPIGTRELDVIIALCKASPFTSSSQSASKIAVQLSQYLPDSHSQFFRPSPFLHNVRPSPWEALTYNLTLALLSLGSRYEDLRSLVSGAFSAYLQSCAEAIDAVTPFQRSEPEISGHEDGHGFARVLSTTMSLVGFLEASACFASFWLTSEKLHLVETLRSILSDQYMIAVETASSTVRNPSMPDALVRDWRRYTHRYATDGRPVGAMLLQEGFTRFVKSCAVCLSLGEAHVSSDEELLNEYIVGRRRARVLDEAELALLDRLGTITADEIRLLEDGSDYLQLGSTWQQRLAFSVKSLALIGYLNCVILSEAATNSEDLFSWLEATLADPNQMSYSELAKTTLKSIAVVSRLSPSAASFGSRSLLKFIVDGNVASRSTGFVAAKCLAHVLGALSQDAVITTLYSLGNALSPGSGSDKSQQLQLLGDGATHGSTLVLLSRGMSDSATSSTNGEGENEHYGRVIQAIVTIASNCEDGKISALAQSMLLQKIGKVNAAVDASIIKESAALSLNTGPAEFQLLLKFFDRAYKDSIAKGYQTVADAVQSAMVFIAVTLKKTSTLYKIYLIHLLEGVVNKGDATDFDNDRQKEIILAPDDISPFLKPLALLVSSGKNMAEQRGPEMRYDQDISTLFRDAWFNIAIHGITLNSAVAQHHLEELRLLAKHSPSLVSEDRVDMLESDVELNTILRRGMSQQRFLEQKKKLINELPSREVEIKRLSYPRVIFLSATLFIESLRGLSGNCNTILGYFRDPVLATAEMASCMGAIAEKVVSHHLSLTLAGKLEHFSAPFLSRELAGFFVACCHRVERVQNMAVLCANRIMRECPSALCEKTSLFALLELLTVMWQSCIEGELDEYEWKPTFTSPTGIVQVDLPDSYTFRERTLQVLLERARAWVTTVMNISPLDVKGLLQAYLSTSDDKSVVGQISLGRSFALEMGAQIPNSNPRLGSIKNDSIGGVLNIASGFISQLSTRERYKTSEPLAVDGLVQDPGVSYGFHGPAPIVPNISTARAVEDALSKIHTQLRAGTNFPITHIRNVLRQAAAIVGNHTDNHDRLARYLVTVPFEQFSKESIDIGMSLWLGVMHENPRMGVKLLSEIMGAWERSIQRKRNLFDPSFKCMDPFYTKIELLPTDRSLAARNQEKAQEKLIPHLRVLEFFESHFNATRLANAQGQPLFCRLIDGTTTGLLQASNHPLARELYFRIILFSLKVLSTCSSQDEAFQWKIKDQILSAALTWFRTSPRWSFGGNRLQIKAEDRILRDVVSALEDVAGVSRHAYGAYKSLESKQELLHVLIENERSRLRVWLYPLDSDPKHLNSQSFSPKSLTEEATVLLRHAWAENPGLAIQLSTRFPSVKLKSDVRWLMLNFPDKAIDESDGLDLIFGTTLPADVSCQLKYLLYWASVNPTEALTYFLPAYGNHPFILQYAMKALESHPIDVRFYFVPQLVQALRYDSLGYVERYILETAKLSQLFAHQVIWNMKANSYKDEDSQIPDPLKPTLDQFMDALIASFTDEEREFYEREFTFFNEITGISGKLRPYIKRSKAEKKEKIEEELRKIKVEVGVYLPSNPEGIVVGIDRKSGKPLQSHAKAPYMATFRIQKTRVSAQEVASPEKSRAVVQNRGDLTDSGQVPSNGDSGIYEVWQSAIFKVGDDCRQDMLALQMIAAFRSIFAGVGLDVWVFPYRVTSTAPGCGVIDVLPNSISRDMLGREAVNGLYDYFVSKYGGEDSIRFQEARANFVKSMAAYSVISYLLQFKDRHNGNIMIDDAGHIIHIDFGFCFDIAPGGVRFERAPFKLTSEMVAVMSGNNNTHTHPSGGSGSGFGLSGGGSHNPTSTQPYRWFESLVVKAFLASRPYSAKLSHIVSLMLDSGLPCFKPDTLRNFRDRFVLDKSEREAADHMRELVRKSYMSVSTKGYDQFQLLTNGIPY
ncbi:1-phosphatidylinositol 4-kinase STT4 [Aspergillus homomorphus CBS 101889]|uniref:1-phosphatidylinositol 4-kinase n=1 Tax=Aspergillus homomorphus (strain CBS 101889) TaxID=1450537 RepID=A0A395I8W3_ASPHC|nr:phosphatidylinositol 4-kinase [Aspergillus homomorphus CBS 101889]RAL15683.1 phosphatidylinositol 4-kinase [Aspergillus homomorphus CBS 101889]